jgi:hypothetical protein
MSTANLTTRDRKPTGGLRMTPRCAPSSFKLHSIVIRPILPFGHCNHMSHFTIEKSEHAVLIITQMFEFSYCRKTKKERKIINCDVNSGYYGTLWYIF